MSSAKRVRAPAILALMGVANLVAGFAIPSTLFAMYPEARDLSELPFEGYLIGIAGALITLLGVALLGLALVFLLASLLGFTLREERHRDAPR